MSGFGGSVTVVLEDGSECTQTGGEGTTRVVTLVVTASICALFDGQYLYSYIVFHSYECKLSSRVVLLFLAENQC